MRPIVLALCFGLIACGDTRTDAEPTPSTVTDKAATPTAVLDAYYAAAKRADFEAWIALFAEDAIFYGTDASEAWPKAEFASAVEEGFASGAGWDFELRDRNVTVSADGQTAWFAELAHFHNTDYTLRPTGVLTRTDDGAWQISQLVMGVPFPNAIYEPFLNSLQATEAGAMSETAAVEVVLSGLHRAADVGDIEAYFDLFTDDAIFIGSDATERWTMADLRGYAEPAFADGHGWTYDLTERHIILSPMNNVAWFDEMLEHATYGTARGTGTLIRTFDGWKIAQYHLTFPIPNELGLEFATRIREQQTTD